MRRKPSSPDDDVVEPITERTESLEHRLAAARRVLVLGIGGGGDAVGSLAIARLLAARGADFVLGGVAWERFAVDPYPGPRPLDDLRGARPLGPGAAAIDSRHL